MQDSISIRISLLMAALCLTATPAWSQGWTNLGDGLTTDEIADRVRSLAVSTNGELYAGGAFTNTGSLRVSYIAKWNGSNWTNLGSGMNGGVAALAGTNGELYAGGDFTTADGVSANRIARWNGLTWTNMHDGMSDGVLALSLGTSGELYAGGYFTTAGGVSANHIAKWNGAIWTNLGTGLGPGYPKTLVISTNGELYVGGSFTTNTGGVSAKYIAKWNGTTWTNLGSGMNNDVNALAIGTNGELYAGGQFTNAGGVGANRIARWNGSTWTNLGDGMNAIIYALAIGADGELYAGGQFTNAGGVGADRIAKWNGSTWTNLGNGINSTVRALAIGRYGELYAGGNFTNAGEVRADNIAEWAVPVMNVLGTNGAVITNNEPAAVAKGTDFGARSVGASFTNTFSIANNGDWPLEITGVSTDGTGAAYFSVNGMPAVVGIGSSTNFMVIFSPSVAGVHTAAVTIANSSTSTPFRVNLCGQSSGQIGLSVTALVFSATYNGANPASQDLEISNLSLVSFSYTNVIQYGLEASGWLSIFPSGGSIAGGGYQATLVSVNISELNAGIYTATNAVTSTNAWNSPQNLTVTLNISKADQTISFPPIADQVTTNSVGLSATASSGLPVSFSMASGPATISGGATLTFTGAGLVSIVAGQAGNSNWNAAPNVTNSFTVHEAASTPQNVAATDGSYVDKVTVSWSAANGASGYQVWRNTANNPLSASQIAPLSARAYEDSSAAVGVLYYYWVKATNAYSASAFSSSDSGWRADVSAGVCADYDGDRKADPAVYDEVAGIWKVRLSSAGYYLITTGINSLGGIGCASVAADYDGDAKADPAVYNEATGVWLIVPSSSDYAVMIVLGQTLGGVGYTGMPADYDGDLLADPGVYQRENGDWQVMLSSANYTSIELLGLLGGTGYRAVATDYDGDHKADPAVYGESNGIWVFKISSAGYLEIALARTFGGTGYLPVPADYDGDGLADPAVIDSATGLWYIMYSSLGYDIVIKSWTF